MFKKCQTTLLICILLFHSLLFANTSLQNAPIHSFTLYSDSPINLSNLESQARWYAAATNLWLKLSQSDFNQTEVTTSDGLFSGRIIETNEGLALKITEIKTAQNYYYLPEKSLAPHSTLHSTFPHRQSLSTDQINGYSSLHTLKQLEKLFAHKNQKTPLEHQAEAINWSKKSIETLIEVQQLYNGAVESLRKTRTENATLSDEEFLSQFVAKDKVHYGIHGYGVGEVNHVDNQIIIRVVHNRTELAFLIVPENLNQESSHFKKYIARQNIKAGHSRKDGETGRDVLILTFDQIAKKDLNEFLEPNKYSFEFRESMLVPNYWLKYYRSIAKKPTLTNLGFGIFSGSLQFMTATGAMMLSQHFNPEIYTGPHAADPTIAPKLAFVWGATIGTFVSSYREWTSFGTRQTQILKNAANTFLYNYVLYSLMHVNPMADLNPLTWNGLVLNLFFLANTIASNVSKPYYYDIVNSRERASLNRDKISFTLFGSKKIELNLTQSNVENQFVYLVPFFIQLLDRIHFTIGSLPAGKLTLFLSIPIVEFAVMRYVENMANKYGDEFPKLTELAIYKRNEWNKKVVIFYNQKIQGLLIKRSYAKLRRKYDEYDRISLLLNKMYPQFFKATPIERNGEITIQAEPFEIPGRELPAHHRLAKNCPSLLKFFLKK